MRRLFWALLIICVAFSYGGAVMAIEEPQYEVLLKEGDFELRVYKPMLIAEVLVEGSMREASNRGFRLVADYIFGNNEDPVKKQAQKINMTAPVTIEPNLSESISMTVPVTIQQDSSNFLKWKLFFVMPKEYTLDTIPKPKNGQVSLVQLPKQYLAVSRFSGWVSQEKFELKTLELMKWISSKSYRPVQQAQLSRYNPPWTLPFLRRNEVWVKLDLENASSMK